MSLLQPRFSLPLHTPLGAPAAEPVLHALEAALPAAVRRVRRAECGRVRFGGPCTRVSVFVGVAGGWAWCEERPGSRVVLRYELDLRLTALVFAAAADIGLASGLAVAGEQALRFAALALAVGAAAGVVILVRVHLWMRRAVRQALAVGTAAGVAG